MTAYHTLSFGTYNHAAFFLCQRVDITNVKYAAAIDVYKFYDGEKLVALYCERTGILKVFKNMNETSRAYGKLH